MNCICCVVNVTEKLTINLLVMSKLVQVVCDVGSR